MEHVSDDILHSIRSPPLRKQGWAVPFHALSLGLLGRNTHVSGSFRKRVSCKLCCAPLSLSELHH